MGYTLPVFACASAIAALHHLQTDSSPQEIELDLIKPARRVKIPIEQVAKLSAQSALAITRSDPGEHLDITRNTPIWALVERGNNSDRAELEIKGGEGIGKQTTNQTNNQESSAIYSYAQQLIRHNLEPLLQDREKITVTIILPEGRKLATKTSNAAFGIVEGLSLLGTTGVVQPLTAPSQLEAYQQELIIKAQQSDTLVFCIGENGLDLATQWGIDPQKIVKTANWVGSMLVTAATHQVKSILLLGYHGKLIKIAGGIWHTHHHLADGRLEILSSFAALQGLTTEQISQIVVSPTTESALELLKKWDRQQQSNWVQLIYSAIAETIDRRSQAYIAKHADRSLLVGSILFDRQRQIIVQSNLGKQIFSRLTK